MIKIEIYSLYKTRIRRLSANKNFSSYSGLLSHSFECGGDARSGGKLRKRKLGQSRLRHAVPDTPEFPAGLESEFGRPTEQSRDGLKAALELQEVQLRVQLA